MSNIIYSAINRYIGEVQYQINRIKMPATEIQEQNDYILEAKQQM
jgi:hypothetical protein